MRNEKIDAAVEALYRGRDSSRISRLLKGLTPGERKEAFTRAGHRAERDRARLSQGAIR